MLGLCQLGCYLELGCCLVLGLCQALLQRQHQVQVMGCCLLLLVVESLREGLTTGRH